LEESPFEILIHSKKSSSHYFFAIHILASIIEFFGHHNLKFSLKFFKKKFSLKERFFFTCIVVCVISSKHSLLVFAGSDLVERGFGYPKASTQHSKTLQGIGSYFSTLPLHFLIFFLHFSPFFWLLVVAHICGRKKVRPPPTCEPWVIRV
jgi:hypothetical protein